MEFFATGNAPLPDGRVEHFPPHEYGPLIVIYDEPQDFFAPQDADTAREALKLLLAGSGKASEALTAKMTAADQQTMQHIYHKHREALAPAILAEVQKQRQKLAEASPAGHLASLKMPVLLLHGSDDTVIPPTELAWLEREIPKDKLRAALVSPAISHVEVGSKAGLLDRLALVHWMAEMLALARSTGESGDSSHLPAGLWLAGAAR
jgi:pimeloyl-ACP methyl ester carboxylesterase